MYTREGKEATSDHREDTVTSKRSLPLVVKLEFPVKFGETTVSELICERRPSFRCMKRLAAAQKDHEIMEILLEEVFGLTPRQSDMLDIEDGMRAIKEIVDFFPGLGGQMGQ